MENPEKSVDANTSSAAPVQVHDSPIIIPDASAASNLNEITALLSETVLASMPSHNNNSEPNPVPDTLKPQKKKPKFSTVSNKDKTVEIRGGKLIIHESKINFQIHPSTIRELARFHEAKYTTPIQNAIQLEDQLRTFYPLIGKLVQESEKPLAELAIFVKEFLCPTGFDIKDPWNDVLLLSMLETAINEVASRKSYGVMVENPETGESALCNVLCVFRWDVKCVESIFPACLIPAILRRRQEREKLQEEAQQLYKELPIDEQIWICSQNIPRKKRKLDVTPTVLLDEKDIVCEIKPPVIKTPLLKKEKASKPIAKPLAKPALEEVKKKATTSIAGFFSPVKKTTRAPIASEEPVCISDYEKYFHPFRVKHDTSLAKPRSNKVQLTPRFDDLLGQGSSGLDMRGLLISLQQSLANQKQKLLSDKSSELLFDALGEDENQLCGAELLRPKLLHFHDNYRPAFFGAWLKESTKISPRNFLKKDLDLFDYSFDSEEEWQEEEEGELLADSDEDDEDDEDFNSKDGSDSENDDGFIEEDEDLEKDGSDEPAIGKSKDKLRKNPILKPVLFGISYDKTKASSFLIRDNIPLISISYQISNGESEFPIDPLCPKVVEPMTQPAAPYWVQ